LLQAHRQFSLSGHPNENGAQPVATANGPKRPWLISNVGQNKTMPEEIYFAPLTEHPVVRLREVVEQFASRGRQSKLGEESAEMCWLVFEGFESQLVISTTTDEKKEVGLVTLELSEADDEPLIEDIEEIMAALGFSNDPEANYR
jgi:hypothetical protein